MRDLTTAIIFFSDLNLKLQQNMFFYETQAGCFLKLFSEKEKEAVKIIERSWCSYRDQQMFQLLKYAVCAAVSILQI